MLYRDPERFGRLSRKCAPALIDNGPGDHHWQLPARFSCLFVNSRDRCLAIQRIKYRLDKQNIDTAIHQSADLLCISPGQSIKRGRPEDRKSTRLNSSHVAISYAVFCLKKKKKKHIRKNTNKIRQSTQ